MLARRRDRKPSRCAVSSNSRYRAIRELCRGRSFTVHFGRSIRMGPAFVDPLSDREELNHRETVRGDGPITPMNSRIGTAAGTQHPDRQDRTELRVNGQRHSLSVEPWVTLLDLLRERLSLTGTKRAATTGNAVRVPFSWTGDASTPASSLRSLLIMRPLSRSRVSPTRIGCIHCKKPSSTMTPCNVAPRGRSVRRKA